MTWLRGNGGAESGCEAEHRDLRAEGKTVGAGGESRSGRGTLDTEENKLGAEGKEITTRSLTRLERFESGGKDSWNGGRTARRRESKSTRRKTTSARRDTTPRTRIPKRRVRMLE